MPVQFEPFEDDHIDVAARLLAARHARDRHAFPLFPARYEVESEARSAVAAAWGKERPSGVVALENGEVVGYMFGHFISDMPWPRSYWIDLAGHALAAGRDPELYRDFYGAASPSWVAAGAFDHFALIPCGEPAVVEAWFNLSFAKQQVHALRALGDVAGESPAPVEIRRAGADDVSLIADLRTLIAEHQAGSPTYAPQLPEFVAALLEGHNEILDESEIGYLVAIENETALGFAALIPFESSEGGLNIPESCIELSIAATRPEARGRGVGVALTERGLAWAAQQGYATCLTDWRAANLLSSRFWPSRGFVPVTYRMHRSIDPRVSWAR